MSDPQVATGNPEYPNLSAMHRVVARRLGPRPALRFRQHGMFRDLSWESYRRQADCAAAGLLELGIEPGDRIGLLSENRYEWLIADIAVLGIGAADVPMHSPLASAQVAYQLGHSGARGVIVSNQAQADKVLANLDALPELEFLISFNPIGSRMGTLARPIDRRTDTPVRPEEQATAYSAGQESDKSVQPTNGSRVRHLTWHGLIRRGWERLAHNASMIGRNSPHPNPLPRGEGVRNEVHDRERAVTRDSLATIIYTSGTTGHPKGVMLTHGNLLSNVEAMQTVMSTYEADVLLSWLPYSHIYARTVDHYLSILAGGTICLAESIETLTVDLRTIQPTWLTAVPRFYEKVWAAVEPCPPETRPKELRRIFGQRMRRLTSGGAPLPRHVCEGFFAAGMPLYEGYGLTESSPVISFNHETAHRIGSVGRPIPGVEVKIADDGEILTRGPHVMRGYWQNPEATAETIVDGWLHTGDVGRLDDDGFLTITDRKKDLIITSGGKNIAPSELERLLVSDPYIDQAVVYGDGRHFVSALIVPNFANLRERRVGFQPAGEEKDEGGKMKDERQGSDGGEENSSFILPPSSFPGEFLRDPALIEFYQQRIDAVMQPVSQPERVKKFLILSRPFQLEAEELTATLKVRRRHIISKYEPDLAALYAAEGNDECASQ